MNKKSIALLILLLTASLLLITKGNKTYAYVGSIFNYTYEGQTITYKVLSEPTETENGTAQIIYSNEINQNLKGVLTIPSTVTNQRMTYHVTRISNNAFLEAEGITKVDLPSTITEIGEGAFFHCTSLTSINLPKGITRIEDETFQGCVSLSNLRLPEGLTYIGSNAFYDCSSLTSINIPSGLPFIGSYAFYNCKKITELWLPKEIKYIGISAFEGCKSLVSINIPEGVTSIENMLFKDCINLKSVSLPESIRKIGKNAFYNCNELQSIYLSDAITSIGDYAFYLCSSLTSIKIPYSVTIIEDYTFLGCSSLSSIRMHDKVTSIGDFAFYDCKSLISINLPEGLTSIGKWAFTGSESLRPIKIPRSVTSIGFGEYPYCGVLVYRNSYAEEYFKKNYPEYYQIIKVPLIEMSFAEDVRNITVNDTVTLKPFFYPFDSSDITEVINWSSSNPSVVSVDSTGTVKGLSAGEADITAAMGKFTAVCHIIVDGAIIKPTSLAFSDTPMELVKGSTTKLQLYYLPANATDRAVVWTSSNPSILTVENGRIEAKSIGTATIKAATGAVIAECKVTVNNPLKEIFSDYNQLTLNKGDTKQIAISYIPMDTTDDKTTVWRSENESVATVVNGTIRAVNAGTTVITAYVGALKHNISVTVQIPVTELSFSQRDISLIAGQIKPLRLTILPADTTEKMVVTSSDKSVATYSNGVITALKRGTTLITVTCGSFTETCNVTVGTDIESITLNKKNLTLYLGKSETLTAAFNPADAKDDKTITWVSSNKSVVTVDSMGKIKAVGAGTAKITVTAADKITAVSSVTVKLAIPAKIKSAAADYNALKITWGAVSGASGYQIYRADTKTGSYKKIKDLKEMSFTNTGLTTGKTYYYKVRAYRNQGTQKVYSSFSSIISAKPVPLIPAGVKLVKPKAGTAKLTWNKVNGASGYEIYRTSSTKEPFKLTKTTTSLHFINYGLTKGRTYYYKVRAYKLIGRTKVYSDFTEVLSVKM